MCKLVHVQSYTILTLIGRKIPEKYNFQFQPFHAPMTLKCGHGHWKWKRNERLKLNDVDFIFYRVQEKSKR